MPTNRISFTGDPEELRNAVRNAEKELERLNELGRRGFFGTAPRLAGYVAVATCREVFCWRGKRR